MRNHKLIACVLTLLAVVLGCANTVGGQASQDGGEVYLLQDRQFEGTGGDAALLEGFLEVVDGCLVITDNTASISAHFTLVWPHRYNYRQEAGRIEILDDLGETVVRVGEQIGVSGSEF